MISWASEWVVPIADGCHWWGHEESLGTQQAGAESQICKPEPGRVAGAGTGKQPEKWIGYARVHLSQGVCLPPSGARAVFCPSTKVPTGWQRSGEEPQWLRRPLPGFVANPS